MPLSAIRDGKANPSRWRRRSAVWLPSVSVSFETITRNNNTTEVCSTPDHPGAGVDFELGLLAEMSSSKSDRSMSPSTMSEEGRRELIARQHRALYGSDGGAFLPPGGFGDEGNAREQGASVSATSNSGARGTSPRGVDPFGMSAQSVQGENPSQGTSAAHENNRGEKAASPASNTGPASFGTFESTAQQPTKASTPPSGEEGHSRQVSKSTTAPVGGSMGPIGSRPQAGSSQNQTLSKRTTSPLPSSVNHGFGNSDQSNERSASSNSNSNNQKEGNPNAGMGAWGTGSGVWGTNKIGATSVWG